MATTNKELVFHKFGYTEMYEWAGTPPANKFGRFVQFSRRHPEQIEPTHDGITNVVGVSSICYSAESDNPEQWHNTYLGNEVGDIYVKEETLAVGVKQYDQDLEMSYIQTKPWKHHVRVENPEYNKKKAYVARSARREWVRVTLIGKAIVYDGGMCTPGEWCVPYDGIDMEKAGYAVPQKEKTEGAFYVIGRVSPTTVKILVK